MGCVHFFLPSLQTACTTKAQTVAMVKHAAHALMISIKLVITDEDMHMIEPAWEGGYVVCPGVASSLVRE